MKFTRSSANETQRVTGNDVADTDRLIRDRFSNTYGSTGLYGLVQGEIKSRTEFPYLMAGYDAADSVVIFGDAGFKTRYRKRSELDSSESMRRANILAAVHKSVKEHASGRFGRPVWSAPPAAAYLKLTGEKCWDDREEERMAEDSMTLIQAHLEPGIIGGDREDFMLDSAASAAADFRVITGNTSWDDEVNTSMATAALDTAQDYWEQPPDAWGVATIPTARRIASARILLASRIVTVQGNPNRGIDLIF